MRHRVLAKLGLAVIGVGGVLVYVAPRAGLYVTLWGDLLTAWALKIACQGG